MSSVDEKLDATKTGYGSIKDEPKTGGGLKFIVGGMLIGTFIGVVGTMVLITPHSPLARFQGQVCPKNCVGLYGQCVDRGYVCGRGSQEGLSCGRSCY